MTRSTPVQTPALKISPIASQPVSATLERSKNIKRYKECFIGSLRLGWYTKPGIDQRMAGAISFMERVACLRTPISPRGFSSVEQESLATAYLETETSELLSGFEKHKGSGIDFDIDSNRQNPIGVLIFGPCHVVNVDLRAFPLNL
jgi:hypothetical protein